MPVKSHSRPTSNQTHIHTTHKRIRKSKITLTHHESDTSASIPENDTHEHRYQSNHTMPY